MRWLFVLIMTGARGGEGASNGEGCGSLENGEKGGWCCGGEVM